MLDFAHPQLCWLQSATAWIAHVTVYAATLWGPAEGCRAMRGTSRCGAVHCTGGALCIVEAERGVPRNANAHARPGLPRAQARRHALSRRPRVRLTRPRVGLRSSGRRRRRRRARRGGDGQQRVQVDVRLGDARQRAGQRLGQLARQRALARRQARVLCEV